MSMSVSCIILLDLMKNSQTHLWRTEYQFVPALLLNLIDQLDPPTPIYVSLVVCIGMFIVENLLAL